jgi:hypothetical protein
VPPPHAEAFRSPQKQSQPLPLEPAYTPSLEPERPVKMPRLERPAHFPHEGDFGSGGGRPRRQQYQGHHGGHEGYGHDHGHGHGRESGFGHDETLSPLAGDKDPLSAVPRLLSGSGVSSCLYSRQVANLTKSCVFKSLQLLVRI